MNKRPMIGLSRKELTLRIVAGDPLALAEVEIRNQSRMMKGKAPVKAYDSAPAPAPAPSAPDAIAAIVARAVAEALAARGLTPAPAPDVHTDDAMWAECLEACDGSRWAAYDRMETIIGKRKRTRIAAAAGVSVGAVSNAISKHRRGIATDLSFVGK